MDISFFQTEGGGRRDFLGGYFIRRGIIIDMKINYVEMFFAGVFILKVLAPAKLDPGRLFFLASSPVDSPARLVGTVDRWRGCRFGELADCHLENEALRVTRHRAAGQRMPGDEVCQFTLGLRFSAFVVCGADRRSLGSG